MSVFIHNISHVATAMGQDVDTACAASTSYWWLQEEAPLKELLMRQ